MKRPRRPVAAASRKQSRERRAGGRRPRKRQAARNGAPPSLVEAIPAELRQLEELRASLERAGRASGPPRWNANPEEVRRAVMKLVLTLVELIRQLLERQAIRRMEARTLTPDQTEAVGLALMRLEETIRELAAQFDLDLDDLNLDLGPVGRLM